MGKKEIDDAAIALKKEKERVRITEQYTTPTEHNAIQPRLLTRGYKFDET
jgi:hypothetical protein